MFFSLSLTHIHTENAVSVCSLTVTQAQKSIHKVTTEGTTEGSLILHVCTHTHAQTWKYKNLKELQRQTFYYQHNEHLHTLTWLPLLQGCHCMRTKNTYLWGNRAVSVVHYRLSLHEDKEHLPVGKQGSLCGTLQAVTA